MSVALFTHPDMIGHRPGAGHPERPERLQAVLDALDDAGRIRTTLTEVLGPMSAETLREGHRRLESGTTVGKLALTGF